MTSKAEYDEERWRKAKVGVFITATVGAVALATVMIVLGYPVIQGLAIGAIIFLAAPAYVATGKWWYKKDRS